MQDGFKECVLLPKQVFNRLTNRAGINNVAVRKVAVKRKKDVVKQGAKRKKVEIGEDLLSFPLGKIKKKKKSNKKRAPPTPAAGGKKTRKMKKKPGVPKIPGVTNAPKQHSRTARHIIENYERMRRRREGEVPMSAPGELLKRSLKIKESRMDERHILSYFPLSKHFRVYKLIKMLRNQPDIFSWDDDTFEITVEGVHYPNSNFIDMLTYFTSQGDKQGQRTYFSTTNIDDLPPHIQLFLDSAKRILPSNVTLGEMLGEEEGKKKGKEKGRITREEEIRKRLEVEETAKQEAVRRKQQELKEERERAKAESKKAERMMRESIEKIREQEMKKAIINLPKKNRRATIHVALPPLPQEEDEEEVETAKVPIVEPMTSIEDKEYTKEEQKVIKKYEAKIKKIREQVELARNTVWTVDTKKIKPIGNIRAQTRISKTILDAIQSLIDTSPTGRITDSSLELLAKVKKSSLLDTYLKEKLEDQLEKLREELESIKKGKNMRRKRKKRRRKKRKRKKMKRLRQQ